jgi:hypothetical protein
MTYKYDKLQVVRPIVKLCFLIMSMLLGQPWLCNAHVIHHWENNLITIKGNGMVRTIAVTKHLDNNTKNLKVLCYDLMEGVIEEEEEIFFYNRLEFVTFETITLPKPKRLNVKVGIKDLMFNFPHF